MVNDSVLHSLWNKKVGVSDFIAIDRPGYFGDKRETIFEGYDKHYGRDNWKIGWIWNGDIIPFDIVCGLYEAAYYADSFAREDLWKQLVSEACDVYDDNVSNVDSGYDYLVQETGSTHIQDIAVRNVVLKRGWNFKGDGLVQIRSSSDDVGKYLSPGKVPFHMPEYIVEPIAGWWGKGSVEEWYQSAKVLVVNNEILLRILNEPNSVEYKNYVEVSDLVDSSVVA